MDIQIFINILLVIPICDEWTFAFLNGCLVFMPDGDPVLVMLFFIVNLLIDVLFSKNGSHFICVKQTVNCYKSTSCYEYQFYRSRKPFLKI